MKLAGSHDTGSLEMAEQQIALRDRHNGWVFFMAFVLGFFAAPVTYVGIVQATLCNKLGASATVSNLPLSGYLVANIAPLFAACWIPLRLERAVVVWSNSIAAFLLTAVFVALLLPLDRSILLTIVIVQSLLMGIVSSLSGIYLYQCLGRGSSEAGRARALKRTFTWGPLSAVAGSLLAQFILNGGIPFLAFPSDFATLYLIGIPCRLTVAWATRQFDLPPIKDAPRRPFFPYITTSLREYLGSKPLLLLWVSFFLWYSTLNVLPNLSLYTRESMGRDPKELAGLVMALRFGFKSMGGWFLGVASLRWGVRMPVMLTVVLVGSAALWASMVPGLPYLFAFGLMGAGELGGAYFLNYALALSTPATGARNLSIVNLATPLSSLTPAFHGRLADRFGFLASFACAFGTALVALWLVARLPKTRDGGSTGTI